MDRDAANQEVPPTPEYVKSLIVKMDREDRANLRPWILAKFDVRGYPVQGYVEIHKPPIIKESPVKGDIQ